MQGDIFKRYQQSRILDHKKSSFYFVKINTSRRKINTYQNYYDEVCDNIKKTIKDNDKILIVTQKKEMLRGALDQKISQYELRQNKSIKIDTAWFGYIVGKNDWRDYNKVYIIASPNIPLEIHILQWAFWSNKKLVSQMNLKTKTKNKVFHFQNEQLEAIRKGYIASQIYQALTRINRNVAFEAEYYIFHNDEQVYEMVVKNFHNRKVDKFIALDIKSNDNKEREKKETDGDRLFEFLVNLAPGEYKKQYITETLKISNISRCLKHYKIEGLKDRIQLKHHSIIIQ